MISIFKGLYGFMGIHLKVHAELTITNINFTALKNV